jgi:hypothetical protein
LADQEPISWPIRNLSFGLLGTTTIKFSQQFKNLRTYPHPVTRARDLNLKLTFLTPSQTLRLKRGLRPLGALYGPNRERNKTPPLRGLRPLPAQTQPTPAHPRKERPTGIFKNPEHRAATSGGGKMTE